MEESRYSWKQMPEYYNASYYNDKDYNDGKKFIVIDNKTGKEYVYPEVEIRISADGRKYNQRVTPYALWNKEFMAWAICTSKDFVNYDGKEWLTPSVLNYVVEHFEFPEIFGNWNNKLKDYMTQDLWNKAFQRNKGVVPYVPKEYITSEMINALGDIENPTIGNVGYSKLTPELFEKMYFNCDTEHKLNLIPPAPNYRTGRISYNENEGVKDLITQKVADDILSINIRTIKNIPHKFISKEIANKAMDTDPLLMEYVPAQYQTPEYQKKAIDTKPEYLSLIDPSVVTDEMIYYALSKRGSVLGCVPKEKRTAEVCAYAISSHGGALRNVPDNVKNAQLCFKAVVNDSYAIKYVPVEFLNQEFVNALNSAGVVIPIKCRGYVNECLTAHKKLEEQQLNFEKVVSSAPKIDVNPEYSNIKLESLSGLLTDASLKLLLQNNIMTVGDLLKISDNSEFYGLILNNPKSIYREIRGAIRLLKCKFMDIDPLIEFSDTESDMRDFGKEIGFSARAENALCRAYISPKKLYEIIHNPNEQASLYCMRNVGKSTVQEIIYKTTIVTDFYDKKEKKLETSTEDETIEKLNKELAQIRAEIQRLNARTDEILAKIQEKVLENNKGGVLK